MGGMGLLGFQHIVYFPLRRENQPIPIGSRKWVCIVIFTQASVLNRWMTPV